MVIILDFGSQYTQLIVRKVRELVFYAEVLPFNASLKEIKNKKPEALILSGGPRSVLEKDAPSIDKNIWTLNIPILGICYGLQLMAREFGGEVISSSFKEYGPVLLELKKEAIQEGMPFFHNLPEKSQVWMSHGDLVHIPPPSFKIFASTFTCPVAAMGNPSKKIYGVQFHPEVAHTTYGKILLKNFLANIAHLKPDWSLKSYLDEALNNIQKEAGNGKVILAISGGVDSTVTALMLNKAIPDQNYPFFVDHGLLREGEVEEVLNALKNAGISVKLIEARKQFIEALKGIEDGEKKRKIIGNEFIKILEKESRAIPGVTHLAQGTLYPDVIESAVSVSGVAAKIKTHHNVGGLPANMKLKLIEPLKFLFKDEVRELGDILGLQAEILSRQPFPGPGLAVRIMGEITEERIKKLKKADKIVSDELRKWEKYSEIWQAFPILTGTKTVGVKGDERSYEEVVAIRAVSSDDGMTANWVELPYPILKEISERITREVEGVNRVVYDITTKPPATIEWE